MWDWDVSAIENLKVWLVEDLKSCKSTSTNPIIQYNDTR